MRALLGKVRTRVGYAAVGALLTLAAGGVATAAVMAPATDEVSDVSTVDTPSSTPAAATLSVPSQDTPAPTVTDVTDEQVPAPPPVVAATTSAPATETQEYDPTAPYVDPGTGFTYVPAPPLVVDPLEGEGDQPATGD